ncbi:MAG: hydroxyphenylacetyl-CoA thioesterase PaaI [Roseitalea sp.]|jgi:acyl-CoA thioesterase|nr:hydroxyphenylacetyl-CoA thioesterase PaaI [Roseitalea sp.]MBO6720287.1 hydroxyphenylacetyl-CoA thioesterase PaaI [Roseitalea sp.]MBO6742647.1 hydroxyphenylacetyl-CoA thioesterase PaaI [Roseitalea sp.]
MMTPEDLARSCADAMWRQDKASQHLGMEIEHVAPGEATVAMTVGPHMVNGHGTCHGGYIFTLADSAFAFACNGYNQRTVAQHTSLTFISPGKQGDRLTATGREVSRTGRSGIYDISVTNQDGDVIGEFRGHSRTVPGTILEDV